MPLLHTFKKLLFRDPTEQLPPEERPHYQPGRAFDTPHYEDVTRCRLNHLRTLDLSVKGKRVLDLGSGIGRLADFFVEHGSDVFCVDARPENIEKLRELYPGRQAAVADLENDDLTRLGSFDIVFCYGLLYHVVDVMGMLKRATAVCREMLLIETCIAPVTMNGLFLVRENPRDVTQAMYGFGSRPTPAYVTTCLELCGFSHIYAPRRMPDHVQFQYPMLKNPARWNRERVTRDIFIATRQPLDNPNLVLRPSLRKKETGAPAAGR